MLFRQFTYSGNQMNELEQMDIHAALNHLEGMLEEPQHPRSQNAFQYGSEQPTGSSNVKILSQDPQAFLQQQAQHYEQAPSSNTNDIIKTESLQSLHQSIAPSDISEASIIESMKDIAEEVEKIVQKDIIPINEQPTQAPVTESSKTPRSELAKNKKELLSLMHFSSQQSREELLTKLIHGDMMKLANTAPVSPRKPGVTPRKFEETVQRLYSQRQKYQEKADQKKFQIYQEERANIKNTPGVLKQSQKIMSKKDIMPLYSGERLQIEVDRRNKKIEELRHQTEESKKEKQKQDEEEIKKNTIGVNAKPMSQRAWQEKIDNANKTYFKQIEKRAEKHQEKFKEISFKPDINQKSAKMFQKKQENQDVRVEDRLQNYSSKLSEKKQLLENKLKPTFQPTISSSSKRIHHRTVQNTMMTYYPDEEPRGEIMIPTPMTAPLFEDTVIKEEEKDDSEAELERNQEVITPQVAEMPAVQPYYQENQQQRSEKLNTNLFTPEENEAPEQEEYEESDRSIHQISELNLDDDPANSSTREIIKDQFAALAAPYMASDQQRPSMAQSSPVYSYDPERITIHSKQQSEMISPEKSAMPLNKKRKAKLGAFMTGSSNNSSRKASENMEQKDFFSFKEPNI